MPDETRSIFRHEALWQAVQGSQRTVLPRFIRPRTFLCLWILIGLLALAAVLAAMADVPVFSSGVAVVVDVDGSTRLALLLPADAVDALRVGQTAWINWPEAHEPRPARIISIEEAIHSPADVRERFALSSDSITGPAVVAFAAGEDLLPKNGELPARSYRGSIAPVQVQTGARPLISLLTGLDIPE